MASLRRLWLVGLIAFIMAVAGVFVGRAMSGPAPGSQFELHAQLAEKLELKPEQRAKVASVEEAFTIRRKSLEQQMRAANERLALAIEVEHGYGPQVTTAIDDTHRVMGDLQKETLQYLFAMREVLDARQARTFDKIVVEALTADAR